MDEALYMVTLPCGSIRYLDDACVDYLDLNGAGDIRDIKPLPVDTINHSDLNSASVGDVFEPPQAQLAKRWQDLFPPEWQHPALKAIDLVCRNNQAASFEFDKGKLGKSLITIKPLCDAQANIIALAWHGKPLVVRNQYQTAFESSVVAQWVVKTSAMEHLLDAWKIDSARALAYTARSPQFVSGLRSSVVVNRSNEQALILFSCEKEDFSQKFASSLSEEQLLQIASVFIDEKSAGKRQDFFLVHVNNLLVSFNLPISENSVPSHVLFFNALDISALKQAEKTIEEREDFLGAILKAIPDYVFVVDLKTLKPVFKNRNLAEDLGFDVPSNDNLVDLVKSVAHPDDRMNEQMLKNIYQRLAADHVFETSIRLKDKKNNWKQLYFRCAAMDKDEQGHILNAVVIARDITEVLMTEKLINEKQKQYQLLADNYNDAVLATDCNLNITFVSPSMMHVLGYDSAEFLQLESPFDILGFKQKKSFLERVLADAELSIIKDDYCEVIESAVSKKDGQEIEAEIKLSVLRDAKNNLEGMLFVIRDITQRKRYEHDRLLAAKVFETSTDGIYITDTAGRIEQINRAFCETTGHRRQDIIGKKPSVLGSGWHSGNFEKNILPVLNKTGAWTGELMSRRKNGEAFLVAISISTIHSLKGKVSGYITSFRDITEAKNSEAHVKKLAYFDPLTELPNRMLFQDRLMQAIQRGIRNRHYVSVLFIDLDSFKPVNDRYGHALGDQLLSQVALRLIDCVRGDDTVARLGGDEFSIILHSLKDRHSAESISAKISKKIIRQLSNSFDIQGETIKVGASIGIALYPDDSIEQDSLLRYADIAMYHAKKSGKNQYQFFTHDMHARDEKRQEVAQDIESALERDEFVLAYQPKFDINNLSLLGVEALLRWQHPTGGLLKPASFMSNLKELGMGKEVGEMVFHKACKQLEQLNENGFNGTMSVNVFPRHFRDGQLPNFVNGLLSRYKIKSEQLQLEISESIVAEDPGFSFACLSALKKVGVGLALDDFATGELALQNLRRLAVDEIKLDRQFIRNIDHDKSQLQFVKTLINLAKGFGKVVCVEGIEREDQLNLLRETSIDQVQGYLMSKPLLPKELDEFLEKQVSINVVLKSH